MRAVWQFLLQEQCRLGHLSDALRLERVKFKNKPWRWCRYSVIPWPTSLTLQCGSICLISSGPIMRISLQLFCWPLLNKFSNLGISSGSVATISWNKDKNNWNENRLYFFLKLWIDNNSKIFHFLVSPLGCLPLSWARVNYSMANPLKKNLHPVKDFVVSLPQKKTVKFKETNTNSLP